MWGEDDPFVLKRLEGISSKPILSVANYISLDADCIVAGSTDRTIRFYDTQTMDEVMKTTMDKKNVSIVAVSGMSPEGDDPIIVTGGKDSVIQVWNPEAGTIEKVIKLPTSEVKSLAVYQGSRTLIAIGTRDSKVLIWDVGADKIVATFEGHRASVYCVSITVTTPDLEFIEDDMKNLCIASGGADRTVRTWDLVSGKRVKKFRHARSISSIIVTNRGIRPLLASAGVERVIKIWDLDSGILLRCLSGHYDQITTMALWEGNQMFIISGSADHTIRIFDMISGECICVLKGHRDSVLNLTIADLDAPKILSTSEDLSIIQWDLEAIIDAFYDNSEEGEGARTNLPPYLPPITYVPPAELDRSRLSKEERKRIRKERKRAKRLRNVQSFTAANSKKMSRNNNNNNEEDYDDEENEQYAGESFVFDDDDDEDNEDDKAGAIVSIPDAIKEAVAAVQEFMKEGEDDANMLRTPSKASLLRIGSNKVLPDGADHHDPAASSGLIKGIWNKVFHSGQHKVGVEPPSSTDETKDLPAEEKLRIDTSLATQQATPSKPLVVGEENSTKNMVEYQSITKMKQESFSLAVADHMREHDRKKSQASEKLRNRLNMKKAGSSISEAVTTNATENNNSSSNSNPENGDVDAPMDADAKKEFMRVKAEKLRQHKLQEQRRRESMLVSKNRSGLALQKRLEDLKTKRQNQQQGGGNSAGGTGDSTGDNAAGRGGGLDDLVEMADEGDDDDDDDDGNNSDNER